MIPWHITFVICFIRVSQPPAPNPSLISGHQKRSQLTAHSSERVQEREALGWITEKTSKMSISPLRRRGAKLLIAFGAN